MAAIIIVLLLLLAVGAVVGFYVYRLKVKNDTTPFRTALQRMTGKPSIGNPPLFLAPSLSLVCLFLSLT